MVLHPFATEEDYFNAMSHTKAFYDMKDYSESMVSGHILRQETTSWCAPAEARAEGEGTVERRDVSTRG
jgi:hypothetical protein